MKYLLDTNVVSELSKPQPDAKVVHWIDSAEPHTIFLSVMTIGEIRRGVEKLQSSARREYLETWLNNDLLVQFEQQIVPFDVSAALICGEMAGKLDRAGQRMSAADSFIAATALEGGFTLVTRNVKDFARSGVKILNPWD